MDASLTYVHSQQKLAQQVVKNGMKLRHSEKHQSRQTSVNFATFSSKGRPTELASGYDDYT